MGNIKKMSATKRVQQWATFARMWYIFDAKWQDPFHSAKLLSLYLTGQHKPIYHPLNDCGDQLVIINSKEKAIYSSIKNNLNRKTYMTRLHIFPGSEIPDDIKSNISGQIKPLKLVPKPLQEYSQEEIESYPKVFDYPKDYIVR